MVVMEENANVNNIDKNVGENMGGEVDQNVSRGLANSSVNNLEESKEKKNIWMCVGIGVAVVLLIAVVILLMTFDKKNTDEGAKEEDSSTVEEDEVVIENNTELTSGSVTTTIGGKSVTYSGAYVVDGIEATIASGTYESVADNEVVFLVINGGSLVINGDVTISKTGSADFTGRGDDYSFYGINSAIVVVGDGSSASINGAIINTSVSGANAVVATNGGVVGISDSTISTTADNSRGLHATYTGAIEADDVTISTQGGSCAALATDRGTGSVTATGMTLNTAGAGSPLIYSTGEITVTDSTGTATGAQIAVVEGKNSIVLEDCEFSANGNGNRNEVDNAGVMIYQSMSGDADTGTGSFTATDCTFTILEDSSVYATTPFFFITNTTATVKLTDVTANFYKDGYLMLAAGTEEWGRSGSNGGKVTIDALNLKATNTKIGVDEISSVEGLN